MCPRPKGKKSKVTSVTFKDFEDTEEFPSYKKEKEALFLGEKVSYKNVLGKRNKYVNNLASTLNISPENAKKLIEPGNINRLALKNNQIVRVNLRKPKEESSLLLKRFAERTHNLKNEILFEDNIKIKNTRLFDEIPKNKKVALTLRMTMTITVSDDEFIRKKNISVTIAPKDIKSTVISSVDDYLRHFGNAVAGCSVEVEIVSAYSDQILTLTQDMRLRDDNPLDLKEIYENVEINDSQDCVKAHLRKRFKMSDKVICALGNENGVTCDEIKQLCIKYDIRMHAYDINNTIIEEYLPEKRNKKYPIMYFIATNNHLYPSNGKPQRKKNDKLKIEVVKCIYTSIIETLNKNIYPSNVTTDGKDIISYVSNSINYVENNEFEQCRTILKEFGIEEKIYATIKLSHIFEILSELFVEESTDSFFPESSRFIKGGFNYKTDRDYNNNDLCTIDKNKSYTYSLSKLPFLIVVDYRNTEIETNNSELIDHYLYIVKPEQSSILLPDTNIYCGEFLKFCKEKGLQFEILESIKTKRIPNYYKKMVEEMYKRIKNDDFKKICVIAFGKFEEEIKIRQKYVFNGIFNKDNLDCINGFKLKINDKYSFSYDVKEHIGSIYNKKPISIQIKDESRKTIFLKLKELKIADENIVQIKTDSITYKGKYPTDLNSNLDGWKKDKFTPFKESNMFSEIFDNEIPSFKLNNDNENVIINCYAGCGKTYDIIHNVIPKLTESYIVLTPSHTSLSEYRKNNLNCDVIQKYEYDHTIPKYKNIIIDEFGMCSKRAHDMIYKCFFMRKQIYAYGDFKQLPPPGEDKANKYNSELYFNSIFNKKQSLTKNMRNDFTIDYYDSIIDNKIDIIDEVEKHSIKQFEDAEYILCYRNDTVDKYNGLMLLKSGKNQYDEGLKYICTTNDLREKNMYNNFEYIITKSNEETDEITLDNDMTFTKKEMRKHFKLGYARTIYCIQGKSIKSYYYAPEDKYFINPETAYVIISRLKTK